MVSQRELLAAAIDIREWLVADANSNPEQRRKRDREIAGQVNASMPRADRVLAWWHGLAAPSLGRGGQVAALVSIANGIMLVVGVVLGLGVAGASLTYQGDHPVNLLALLGILVGIPTVMLVLQLIFVVGRLPLPAAISDALAVLSPSRWAGTWLQRGTSLSLFETISGVAAGPISDSAFARWQLLVLGQTFAVGFFAGALVMASLLVIFTDLAFGWSTTLDIDSARIERIVRTLALPWSNVMPSAVPDAMLVEASRFFRLDERDVSATQAAALGRWWPFVMMTIACYGLLPRILLAVIANRRLRRETARLLEEGPDITALLDRMTSPQIDFGAGAATPNETDSRSVDRIPALSLEAGATVIVWNSAVPEDAFDAFISRHGQSNAVRIDAAEDQDPEEQTARLADLVGGERIVVLTKGWEPPLLSFTDYLALVREKIGRSGTIVVVPLSPDRASVDIEGEVVWSKALSKCGDPAVYVAGQA